MTITKEGALTSFYTVNKAPIKHLKVYFSPKQAGEGDPSSENIRPIEGWNGVEVTHCGKNLYNPANVIMNQELFPAGDLYSTGASNNWCVSDYMPVKPNTTYIATALLTRGSGRYALYDENKNYIRGALEKVGADAQTIITTNADARYARLTIRIGDKLNTIFEESVQESADAYYPGQFHTLDWSSNIGTVYGGYMDLITGELVQEYASFIFDENTQLNFAYNSFQELSTRIYTIIPSVHDTTANCYVSNASPGAIFDGTMRWYRQGAKEFNLYIPNELTGITSEDTNDSATTKIKAFLANNPTQYVYKLATSITNQLTPTQLQTLIGRNNIWSNADRIEVEYDLAESNDELYRRRNIILKSAPHIETVAGSIANFETDMQAPLKECKVYFNPVQEGSGDSSPDNIRSIMGWTGVEVCRAGDNLFDKSLSTDDYRLGLAGANYAAAGYYVSAYIPVSEGQVFTKNSPTADAYHRFCTYSSNGAAGFIRRVENNTITIAAGENFIRICGEITEKDTTMLYVDNPATLLIDWTTEAGTIYGGYLDLVKGEIVEEWHKIIADGVNVKANRGSYKSDTLQSYGGAIVYLNPLGEGSESNAFCDNLLLNSMTTIPTIHTYARGQMYAVFYLFPYSDYEEEPTATDIMNATNEWLQEHPVTIVYKLRKPIHHQLTSQVLKTLRGQNNIWSNSNGPVEIKYWTH